jgi:2-polyprenyl-3-methyl-5-hydroxy-6-metoxy-1,4-benzoquinol methylase
MPHVLDYDLTAAQKAELARIPSEAWFTSFEFRNARSPNHTGADPQLDSNHQMKMRLIMPWIKSAVKGKRVLDIFCANGAFAVEAALAGAREVVGIDFSKERVDCANFLASTLVGKIEAIPKFITGNVYEVAHHVSEPFDVVLAVGGLYHVADPPYVLKQIHKVTRELLIVQTSSILPGQGNRAQFTVRRKDLTSKGLSSIRGGYGAWSMSAACFEEILYHSQFHIVESSRPPVFARRKFPWYCALAKPMDVMF